MACGKMFVVLCFFTCIVLIECRSLQYFGVSTSRDGGSEIKSEPFVSNRKGFDESLADFQRLGDGASVTALQRKSIIKGQLVSSSEAAWNAMSPKLRCGDDLMKLQLRGPEVAQIELCRDNGAPVPLTNLPPHCGSTIPTYEGLVYTTPYDGCGVMQQGGSYVMQIQWQGNSALISCPISTTANEALLAPSSPAYMQILLHHTPLNVLSSTADTMQEPSTETGEQSTLTAQEILKPQPPKTSFLPSVWPSYHPNYYFPGTVYPIAKPTGSSTKPTVSQVSTQNRQQPFDSSVYSYSVTFDSDYSEMPLRKPTPNFPTTDFAQDPTQKPQFPGYPLEFWPYSYPYYQHGKPKPPEKPVLTSISTDTSVAQEPTQKPQLPGYPQEFWPFYYPHHPVRPNPWQKPDPAIPTAFPSSSPATTQEQQPLMYPGDVFPQYDYYPYYRLHWQPLYLKYPVQPPKTPAMPPSTIPPSFMLYEKDPFALQFVDLSEIAADSFP